MTFCLISCSIACIVTMFWSICSCLTASCSTPRRTAARSRAMGASCCTNSRDGAAPAVVVESGNNQPNDGARILTASFALSPLFRQTDVATTPIRIATEIRARGPNMRLTIDSLLRATRLLLKPGGRGGRPERTGGSIGRVPPRRSNMGSRSPPGQPSSAADLGLTEGTSSRSRCADRAEVSFAIDASSELQLNFNCRGVARFFLLADIDTARGHRGVTSRKAGSAAIMGRLSSRGSREIPRHLRQVTSRDGNPIQLQTLRMCGNAFRGSSVLLVPGGDFRRRKLETDMRVMTG